ncbi:MAG: hypothetical protein G01um101417_21 [Parcubacteria group bacterium Gr01-1014_17]|nr:MAG: hypothetical protein G01um101417_21 [Parcubacteria group bacterium Gr01-1014_17]
MSIEGRPLERIIKGFANHRRLAILALLKKKPELSVIEIARAFDSNYENTSDHIRKLAIAGLVLKRYQGKEVRHKITERAEAVLSFCKELSEN